LLNKGAKVQQLAPGGRGGAGGGGRLLRQDGEAGRDGEQDALDFRDEDKGGHVSRL